MKKTGKSILCAALSAAMVVALAPTAAFAAAGDTAGGAMLSIQSLLTAQSVSEDWEQHGTCEFQIDDEGTLTIRPLGNGASGDWGEDGTYWSGSARSRVTKIVVKPGVTAKGSAASEMFTGLDNAVSIDLSGLDTSEATDMSLMFEGCSSLTSLDLSPLDTSRATNMSGMFSDCSSLASLDLSPLDTANATDINGMFSFCTSLTTLDLSPLKTSNVTDMSGMFNNCTALTSLDLSPLDASKVTNMDSMFQMCSSLVSLDLSPLDAPNVTNMDSMFWQCTSLTTLDLSPLHTDKVEDMWYMFCECKALTTLYDDGSFVPASGCDTSSMFERCTSLVGGNGTAYSDEHLDGDYARIDTADTPGYFTNVNASPIPSVSDGWTQCGTCEWQIDAEGTLTIRPLGDGASGELTGDVPWRNNTDVKRTIVKKYVIATNTRRMFAGLVNMTSIDLSGLDTSIAADMTAMFQGCSSLTSLDLSSFNTSNVEDMSDMFSGCSSLSYLDFSSLDTSKVTSMSYMFSGCRSLTSLDLSSFDTSSVSDMSYMFAECSSLSVVLDDGGFVPASGCNTRDMFFGCDAIRGGWGTTLSSILDGYYARVDTQSTPGYFSDIAVSDGWTQWGTCEWQIDDEGTLTIRPLGDRASGKLGNGTAPWENNADIKKAVVKTGVAAEGENTSYLFYNLSNLTSIDLSGLDTSDATDMSLMFCECPKLTSLDLSSFDTSNATSMREMFGGCSSLESLDLSGFDTSNVTNMTCMFYECSSLTALNLSSFDTKNVVSMPSMFESCSSLKSLDLSSFDTMKAEEMHWMFAFCSSLTELDLSSLSTENATTLAYMFDGCSSLKSLDLSSFDTSKAESVGDMFYNCSSLTTLTDDGGFALNAECNSKDMFGNCTSLKGGNGTAYSKKHTDGTYARIDTPNAPGYFTDASQTVDESGVKTVVNEDGTATVTGVSEEAAGAVVIPAEVDGHEVTAIAEDAFADCEEIYEISLPAGVTDFGDGALKGLSEVSAVVVESQNQYNALEGNKAVLDTGSTDVALAQESFAKSTPVKTLIKAGDAIYERTAASELQTYRLDPKFANVNSGVAAKAAGGLSAMSLSAQKSKFSGDGATVTFALSAKVKRIAKATVTGKAFGSEYRYPSMVTVGTGVTQVAAKALQGHSTLWSVSLGTDVKKVGARAFYNCPNLTSVTVLSKKLTKKKVGAKAFAKGAKKGVTLGITKSLSKKARKTLRTLLISRGLSKKGLKVKKK